MAPVVIGTSTANITLSNARRVEVGQLVDISFQAGTLAGQLPAIVWDLSLVGDNLQKLYDTLTGEVILNSLEDQLDVRFVGSKTGGVGVDVSLHLEGSPDIRLQFAFELDQTFLPPIIAALKANSVMLAQ
jgi:hypothetical protein